MDTATRQQSTLFQHTLPNGLQMLGQYIPGVESAAIMFWVKTGTRDEIQPQMGVSHFLEHMAFKRTPRLTGREVDRAFEEMGADHNAATSMEMTFYWARVLSENVPWALDVVSQLTRPLLQKDDFEQERQVILEEIARGEDSPVRVLLRSAMSDFFGAHPLGWDTLGTPETIRALEVEQMREYWAKRYGARNIIFAIAGKFDWKDVVNQVQTLTADWPEGEAGRPHERVPFRPGLHVYRRERFVQEQVAIMVPSVDMSDPRYYAAALLGIILGDDSASRLFWSLRHTGIAETASAQVWDFEDNGLFFIHLVTNPDRAAEAIQVARAELARLQEFDVLQDELDRAKAKLESSLVIGGESTNDRVMRLIGSWLAHGELETLDDLRQKIAEVKLEDLQQVVRDFPLYPEQLITAVGPMAEHELSTALEQQPVTPL